MGGAFTIHQLMSLFNIFTNNEDYKKTPFPFIAPLFHLTHRTHILRSFTRNNIFHSYVLINKKFHNKDIFNIIKLFSLCILKIDWCPYKEYELKSDRITYTHTETLQERTLILGKVFRSFFKKYDDLKIRVVAIYRGTKNVNGFEEDVKKSRLARRWSSIKDWQNNWRNLLFGNDKSYRIFGETIMGNTIRQDDSNHYYNRLKDYLKSLQSFNNLCNFIGGDIYTVIWDYNANMLNTNVVDTRETLERLRQENIKSIEEFWNDFGKDEITYEEQKVLFEKVTFIDDCLEECIRDRSDFFEEMVGIIMVWFKIHGDSKNFMKENLSSLGFSQGAVYAYLNGSEGNETIVYNPTPFRGIKPDNTYILRTKNDVVSMFTSRGHLGEDRLTTKDGNWFGDIIGNHKNDVLIGNYDVIGANEKGENAGEASIPDTDKKKDSNILLSQIPHLDSINTLDGNDVHRHGIIDVNELNQPTQQSQNRTNSVTRESTSGLRNFWNRLTKPSKTQIPGWAADKDGEFLVEGGGNAGFSKRRHARKRNTKRRIKKVKNVQTKHRT